MCSCGKSNLFQVDIDISFEEYQVALGYKDTCNNQQFALLGESYGVGRLLFLNMNLEQSGSRFIGVANFQELNSNCNNQLDFSQLRNTIGI